MPWKLLSIVFGDFQDFNPSTSLTVASGSAAYFSPSKFEVSGRISSSSVYIQTHLSPRTFYTSLLNYAGLSSMCQALSQEHSRYLIDN